ncbi:MAG: leucine-rich repeat domain-containing protein [Kofleriaceae bacterium]
MAKSLASKISSDGSELRLFGTNKDDRFTDDELAGVTRYPALEEVLLSRQPITRLPPLVAPKRLQLFDLGSLKSLAAIEEMVSLERVSLSGGHVTDTATYKHLAELPELVDLDLYVPNGELPKSLAKLQSLIHLTIYAARASGIEPSLAVIAKLPALRSLKIERYDGTLPATLGKLTRLEKLEIGGFVKMSALPAAIGKLSSLKHLAIGDTKIRELPDELYDCTALEQLWLDRNPIKTLSPKIAQLTHLKSLGLAFTNVRVIPKELGRLANLRELRITHDAKEMPPEVYALALDDYQGPHAKNFTLRDPAIPTQSEVELGDATRIPASFGQPRKLEISFSRSTPKLEQLARCTQLRELEVSARDLAAIIPFIPPSVVDLRLSRRNAGDPIAPIALLPPLPNLESLSLSTGFVDEVEVGYPKLERLGLYGVGTPLGLARTQLSWLRMFDGKLDASDLTELPLKSLHLRDVRFDMTALCKALAGKRLDELEITTKAKLVIPAAVGTLAIKRVSLIGQHLAIPPEIGAIRGLVELTISAQPFEKKHLPGRWRTKRWGSQLIFTRSDR